MAGDGDSSMADDDTSAATMGVSTADAPSEANDLATYEVPSEYAQLFADSFRQMLSQRLIKVFVASATEPYLIQQAVLEQTSEYFAKAIKNEHLGATKNIGILRFPCDDHEVWKLLLFWMFKGEMPVAIYKDIDRSNAEALQRMYALMIQCWSAGDRYLMPDFQDVAMLNLLHLLETSRFTCIAAHTLSWPNIKMAFDTSAPGSKMRLLAARNAVNIIYKGEELKVDLDEQRKLECLEGIPGALSDLFTARDFLLDRITTLMKNTKGRVSIFANIYGVMNPLLQDDAVMSPKICDLLTELSQIQHDMAEGE